VTIPFGPVLQRARASCERHGVALSLALACAVRLPGLGSAPLSLDEAWTWYRTNDVIGSGAFWRAVTSGVDAPLFGVINVLVAKIAGLSILGLRGQPALFGAASVPLMFVLVRRGHTARLALPVALLAACSPYLVFYSRDASPYTQLLFFTLLFTYAFDATRVSRPLSRRLALGACAALAVASHYYALVYLAAFYTVALAGHRRAGRREELRADLLTGCLTVVAIAPFLSPLLFGLGHSSVPYWQVSDVSLPGILAEQFLFLGTTLPHGGVFAAILNLSVFGLLVLPLLDALRRRSELVAAEPVLSSLWWLAPGMVAGLGILIGQDLLFYPRGFISTAPFLLTYWVLFTRALSGPSWARRAYGAVLLVPFVLSGYLVATSDPAQAYLRGRESLAEVVRQVDVHRDEFDLIVVHHWWLAPYFSYYSVDRSKVWALGRDSAGPSGALGDVDRVPPGARVLLVLNDVARSSDPGGGVVAALMSRRSLIRELPCPGDAARGRGLVCNRMLLFGPADPVRPDPP
jgi:4-amino-4-deoxy-L-arabinose transferase-like glycosyltransferase